MSPVIAAAFGTAAGALFGVILHLFTDYWSEHGEPAFNIGFPLTGTVMGLSLSYCSYISRRLQQRSSDRFRERRSGIIDVAHGALAGGLFFGGGSFVLSITALPFMNGEPKGVEWYLFLINGLFSLGGGLLVDLVGIHQSTLSEMIHSENATQVIISVLCVPIGSAVFGAFVGILVVAYFKIRL